MKTIGVIGMGKMGQAIVSLIEMDNQLAFSPFYRLNQVTEQQLRTCDVVIEFTTPEAAPDVIKRCLELRIPTVSGTTGWHEYHLEEILTYCKRNQGKFFYATNFSIGMNIVFALNAKLATILDDYPQFKPAIREIHHIHKKDSPSGTAYTLIEGILKNRTEYSGFQLNASAVDSEPYMIPVEAIREGEVKGYHQVTWNSGKEKIGITHEAFDRSIFAAGAIMAAQWLLSRPAGTYTMRDIIHL
jgi:4-hydroxy-tetrahydrodipicolinate reductase